MFWSRFQLWLQCAAGAGLLSVALVGAGNAQEGVTQRCPAGMAAAATLGFEKLRCECTISESEERPGTRVYEFWSEPTIGGIKADGPAAGKLRKDDVIAAIDGYLITTREGGRRFGQLQAGIPVTLRVRRGGREIDVSVTPAAACEPVRTAARAPRAALPPRPAPEPRPPRPVAPRPARAIGVPAPPALPESRARLGFSVRCSDCSLSHRGDKVVWTFRDPPAVQRVERDGPAAAAGIRAGDILTHINAVPLTSDEGGRLFGAVEPGDTVRLRVVRGGVEREVQVVPDSSLALARRVLEPPRVEGTPPAPAPAPVPAPALTPPGDVAEPRFSGSLGDAFVQVTGGPVTVTRTVDEIVIRSQDITVRISTGAKP